MVGKKASKTSSASRAGLPQKAKGHGSESSSNSSASSGEPPKKKLRPDEPGDAPDGFRDSKNSEAEQTKKVTRATTFGIEFEFVLAFHEKMLDVMKEKGIVLDIIKEYDHSKQYALLNHELEKTTRAFTNRTLWPSWLLEVSENDEAISNDAVRGTLKREFDGKIIRRYVMEPLLIAQQALAKAGLNNVQVIGWTDTSQTRSHCPECGGNRNTDPDHYTTKYKAYGTDALLRSMVVDYNKWMLTNDYTLVSVRRAELENRLDERGIRDTSTSWDSYGLELVTRIMQLDKFEDSFDEIRDYLSALKAKEHVDVLESVWATAHVHIGFDAEKKADLSHDFFQHVAFLLLSYERLITLCFPRRCSGAPVHKSETTTVEDQPDTSDTYYTSDDDFEHPIPEEAGNESEIRAAEIERNDEAVKKMEEEYTCDEGIQSNHRYICECLATKLQKDPSEVMWHDIRDEVFSEKDNMAQLMQYMQKPEKDDIPDGQRHRGYMVNWCNIYTIWTAQAGFKNFKPTLEFRQHPCTTDANEIKHWVLLLQAVMVLARKMVLQDTKYGASEPLDQNRTSAEREASKYPNNGWPFQDVKSYVTQLLGLSDAEGLYWENRYEKYKDDRPL